MAGQLTDAEVREIAALYESRYRQHGDDVRTVGWSSPEQQTLRFDALCRNLELRGRSILDVGCGLGHLIPYLDRRIGRDYRYLGIDIAADLVEAATQAHAGEHRRFRPGDLRVLRQDERFDVVLLSGALNYRIEDNLGYAKAMLRGMFEASDEAVAANFLSSHVDYENPVNYHYRPDVLFDFAKTLTRWVTLIHDYPLWEFTLQLFRQPQR